MSSAASQSSNLLDDLPEGASSAEKTPVDYIVVGSGAGGGPLAARLALGGMRVLVLEQGPDPGASEATSDAENASAIYHCPGLHEASTEPILHGADSAADTSWPQYVRHYQDDARQQTDPKAVHSSDFQQPRQLYPRARSLGGCTAHHAMIAIAPPDEDWQYIAD